MNAQFSNLLVCFSKLFRLDREECLCSEREHTSEQSIYNNFLHICKFDVASLFLTLRHCFIIALLARSVEFINDLMVNGG